MLISSNIQSGSHHQSCSISFAPLSGASNTFHNKKKNLWHPFQFIFFVYIWELKMHFLAISDAKLKNEYLDSTHKAYALQLEFSLLMVVVRVFESHSTVSAEWNALETRKWWFEFVHCIWDRSSHAHNLDAGKINVM